MIGRAEDQFASIARIFPRLLRKWRKISTKNQFIGAQIGVKAEKQFGQFDGAAVAKVALGDNYQTVSINGTGLITGTGFAVPAGLTPGGIFSQATNIGQQTRNAFAVVPEVQLQAGYRMQNGVRFFVGYNFLYVSNVVRPGDQIDTTLNLTGNPALAPGTLTGATRPAPMFNSSSLWPRASTSARACSSRQART
jgi:hypothetical protein